MSVNSIKSMYLSVIEFEVGVNDSVFSGDKQQKGVNF